MVENKEQIVGRTLGRILLYSAYVYMLVMIVYIGYDRVTQNTLLKSQGIIAEYEAKIRELNELVEK